MCSDSWSLPEAWFAASGAVRLLSPPGLSDGGRERGREGKCVPKMGARLLHSCPPLADLLAQSVHT